MFPQGTVLGPLMFLLYINDIKCGTSSHLKLFADDCVLNRTINSQQDHLLLQHDLNIILKWTETWLMELNISKCVVLTCNRLTSSSTFNYTIRNYFLQRVTQHPYLGILLDSKMSFTPHINQVISKATRMLNFVKRNLYRCCAETKCLAYTSIVRPLLEYGSAVWDSYLQKEIQSIEILQRRTARWVKSDYRYNSSVTSMLADLQWPSLQHQRYVTRLKVFYNIVYSSSVLTVPNYSLTPHIPPTTTTPSILRFRLLEQIIINSAITPNLSVIGTIYQLTQ